MKIFICNSYKRKINLQFIVVKAMILIHLILGVHPNLLFFFSSFLGGLREKSVHQSILEIYMYILDVILYCIFKGPLFIYLCTMLK